MSADTNRRTSAELLFREAPMLDLLLLAAYFCFSSVSLCSLALVLCLQDRHNPELRGTALLMGSLGAVSLALASVLWMEGR